MSSAHSGHCLRPSKWPGSCFGGGGDGAFSRLRREELDLRREDGGGDGGGELRLRREELLRREDGGGELPLRREELPLRREELSLRREELRLRRRRRRRLELFFFFLLLLELELRRRRRLPCDFKPPASVESISTKDNAGAPSK